MRSVQGATRSAFGSATKICGGGSIFVQLRKKMRSLSRWTANVAVLQGNGRVTISSLRATLRTVVLFLFCSIHFLCFIFHQPIVVVICILCNQFPPSIIVCRFFHACVHGCVCAPPKTDGSQTQPSIHFSFASQHADGPRHQQSIELPLFLPTFCAVHERER